MIYRHKGNGYFAKLDMKPHLASITPKSPEQVMIANSLVNKDIPLVSMIGRAGSGKTLLAIAAGIQQVLIKHEYRKLIITRPIMPVGKDLGYLPGDVNEKMAEWVRPFMNNIEYIMDTNSSKGKNKIATGKVGALLNPDDCKDFFEILPITYIRGSSISNAFIIVD
jgi:PhoH-like ATPase